MLLTITEAATMYRMPARTLRYRVARAGITSNHGRYWAHQLEAVATASRARPHRAP